MYTIYAHRNKTNGKLYIGQTSQIPEKRWGKDGSGYKTSTKFYRAIQKYGWENFEHLILFSELSENEANSIEESLIKWFRTTDDRYGYNLNSGGQNHHHSEETKAKIGKANAKALLGKHWSESHRILISEMFKGEGNPFYGKHHTEESKRKISESRKGQYNGEKHPFYGKHHSDESKQAISKKRQGKGGKKIRCVNTGEIFDCMMDAARWCGLKTSSSIGQVCNKTGKQKTAGKHPVTGEKLIWEFVD